MRALRYNPKPVRELQEWSRRLLAELASETLTPAQRFTLDQEIIYAAHTQWLFAFPIKVVRV